MKRMAAGALGALFVAGVTAMQPAAVRAQAFDHGFVEETPYVPTPQIVVDAMLRIAHVGKGDFVIDLGSGDGRIIMTAVRELGARGYGVDLNPTLVRFSNQVARELKLAPRARFEQRDVMETPLGEASVVTMYLLPNLLEQLKPRLAEQLKPGTRIVSHDADFTDWQPDDLLVINVPNKPVGPRPESKIRLWIVPARVDGVWQSAADGVRLQIAQEYQKLSGTVTTPGGRKCDLAGKVTGVAVRATACDGADAMEIDARWEGTLLMGTVSAGGQSRLLRANKIDPGADARAGGRADAGSGS